MNLILCFSKPFFKYIFKICVFFFKNEIEKIRVFIYLLQYNDIEMCENVFKEMNSLNCELNNSYHVIFQVFRSS